MSNLSISITEQPTEYHRFRYETEVTDGKLGGLLYGRHGNQSCVRLRITGIDPLLHKSVIVIGGTVNPDGYPHPFYMVGDNCSSGAFHFKRDVAVLGDNRELEIALEKVSLVCVPSSRVDKLTVAINNRKTLSFNPFNKDIDQARYNKRNVKSVKLAFQLRFCDFKDLLFATDAIALSEEIKDAKQQVKLGIFDIHPNTVRVSGSEEVWVYFDELLPHTDNLQFSAIIQADGMEACHCTVKLARKHLLIIIKPDATNYFSNGNERIKCQLVIADRNSHVTDSHEIILVNSVTTADMLQVPMDHQPGKRKRANPDSSDLNMNDLQYFYE